MSSTIYKRKGSPYWWIRFRQNGEQIRKSLKTTDKSIARRIQRKLDEELILGSYGIKEARCPIDQFEERYWPWAEAHKRPKTVELDRLAFRQLMKVARVSDLNQLTQNHMEQFKTEQLAAELKPASINVKLRHLRSMFQQAVNWEMITENPVAKVPRFKVNKTRPRWLTSAQATKVLEVAKSKGSDIHLFFALGIFAGLRKAEISNTRWEWFDFERKVIEIESSEHFNLKDWESRTVPLQSTLAVILEPYRHDSGYLFKPEETGGRSHYRYDPKKTFNAVVKEAGVPWCTPHTLRHTFASLLVGNGVSLFKVGQWLGHSDTRTTQIYAHLAPQDDEIEKLRL